MARILLVEDDENLSDTMSAWLNMKNHQTTIAPTGVEALEQMRYGEFDLVLLDGCLPDMDGIEIATEYRQGGGTLPIVMVTGSLEAGERDRAFQCGINDFMRKPFDLKRLEATIIRFCGADSLSP